MQSAVESLFSAKCPPSLGTAAGRDGKVYYHNYEADSEAGKYILYIILYLPIRLRLYKAPSSQPTS